MNDLARGWAIFWGQAHGHSWAVWVAIFAAVWLSIMGARAARKRADQDADENNLRPKLRTPIPGSEKDYRRQPPS